MDTDEARIDADLGKLLQHIKEGQQNMSDQPGKTSQINYIYFNNKFSDICFSSKLIPPSTD